MVNGLWTTDNEKMSDLHYYIALNLLPDIGPVTFRRLISALGTPENIFRANSQELKKISGIGENRAKSISTFSQWDRVKNELRKAEQNNIRIISVSDDNYPESLKRIYDAPPVIYLKGTLAEIDKYAVAMVGSRSATPYGIQTAEKISYKLASSGLTIVSGMARGIDTASHRGAIDAGGRTIAVLGSGIDVPYPAANRDLMETIMYSGAVISEFPMGTPPLRENFPRRNRIISALSLGVIAVEAAPGSGSLITAKYALEQNKEVFAVPGNIISRNSKGTNTLIKNGAKLVETADDVIEELWPQIKGVLKEDNLTNEKTMDSMNNDEKTIYGSLTNGPMHIDSIIRDMNMPSGRTLSTLLGLELKGMIRQAEGKLFSLN